MLGNGGHAVILKRNHLQAFTFCQLGWEDSKATIRKEENFQLVETTEVGWKFADGLVSGQVKKLQCGGDIEKVQWKLGQTRVDLDSLRSALEGDSTHAGVK